jgi:GNAT superfamily N-acetyltransferase
LSIQISEWDTKHFGFTIAKLSPTLEKSNIEKGIRAARMRGVKLLISRCPTHAFGWIHELERRKFQLMDTLVYYSIDLTKYKIPETKYRARAATGKDKEIVRQIAEASFTGYISHYHSDDKLERRKCRELYERWAVNAFNDKKLANHILVSEIDKIVVAFLIIKIKDDGNTGDVILTAVNPTARGKGVYTDAVVHASRWVKEQGCSKIETPTQITNIFVQKAWASIGGNIDRSYYTFHLWI